MKFLLQGKPAKRLSKLFFGLLLVSATAFAVEQATDYYANINCSEAISAQECTENEGLPVTDELKQLAYELTTSNYSTVCDGTLGETSCSLAGQQLICSTGSIDSSCFSETENFYISCQPNPEQGTAPDQCYVSLNTTSCSTSSANTAICNAVLPQEQLCQLGLSGCNNPKILEGPGVVIKNTLIDLCDSQQAEREICSLINSPDGEQIIDALVPENLDLASDTTKVSQTQLFNYISQHLYQLRQGAPANAQQSRYFFDDAQQGFLLGQQWAASTNLQNDAINDELESIINLSQDGRLSMYVNASFLTARQDLSELEGKSKSQLAMLTTGLDYRLSQGVVGGALSYADGSTEYGKNDSDFDSANYNATVYGSFYKKQWWLDGAVNYGLNRFNQQRDIFCTAASCSQISNIYYADYNGSTLSGQIASGYDFIWGGLSLSPFAQWQLGTVKTDAYSEKAKFTGPTATIAIDKQSRDFSTASLGSYLRYSFATKKAVLVPYLRVVLNHELKDDAQYISGRLVGAANSDFIVRANDRDNNYATIGTGLSMQMQNGNAGFIDVETVEAYDNLSQYQLTGGWRFVF